MKKTALISVSDRTNLVELAKALISNGYDILATSGSGKFLQDSGINCIKIESYTGQAEILDGRVKTLHPKIYAGLLARRDNPKDLEQLQQAEIRLIDIAVINLYPFIENLSDKSKTPKAMQELIDIGGPSMIRAAAKNYRFVMPLIDPCDYAQAIELISSDQVGSVATLDFRRKLASKVFTCVANYNLEIAKYFSNVEHVAGSEDICHAEDNFMLGDSSGVVLKKQQDLRYGENPHQRASFYRPYSARDKTWSQLHGKDLSYNNILDFDATLKIVREFSADKAFCVIIKHLNPCGAASAANLLESFNQAKRTDLRSYFGGIVGFNSVVNKELAQEIYKEFFEIIVAPEFSDDALEVLKQKRDIRLIKADMLAARQFEMRLLAEGALIQEADPGVGKNFAEEAECVSQRKATAQEQSDLHFAWRLCAHVKSNAIVLARNGMLLGIGAGQMSRIDSVELAINKAKIHGHELNTANDSLVAASDAFFPFTDNIEVLAQAGVKAIIAPAGAKKDNEVIESANKYGISLYFAKARHFRH